MFVDAAVQNARLFTGRRDVINEGKFMRKSKEEDALGMDALGMEGGMIDPEDLQDTEARTIPGQKIVYQPSKQEVDDHNRIDLENGVHFCMGHVQDRSTREAI